ncbi:MAG: UbiX family flavin prenyltransferase [Piscinibacter sp.]|uniref:UbiX family flavin prenyltransferase n=1 Tax=Piscinibacter sp. TaxID=1903157 RepID=UPI001B64882F|nr:UbiX family flavin prenyltransferase [Piscinibacter sp.]MBP5991296.1 UbiX family flavin prenyltransferase [Piscinibacter sp.]MBP6028554.1 UbiX family flavin prenyltransferase [Piscinibacter sp.]MBS0443206.1 UbiX family flavin prenyltransferase [Pseudomonadota bacterium]
MKRLIVAITGASGAIYGVRLLQLLRAVPEVETHLVLSQAGGLTAAQELDMTRGDLEALADVVHNPRDIGASVASGSFVTDGMVVAPCSMKTLASIALGLADNLVSRAADVVLKERRRLVLLARETPLNQAHLRNMLAVTEMGGVICPPVPAFYQRPRSLDDVVDHTCVRVLDLFGLADSAAAASPLTVRRWPGLAPASAA